MKRSRFTEEQTIAILKEQEAGLPAVEVRPKHAVSSPTSYEWKAKYGGPDVSEGGRLKARTSWAATHLTLWPVDVPIMFR